MMTTRASIKHAENHIELDNVVERYLIQIGQNHADETYSEAAYRLRSRGMDAEADILVAAELRWIEIWEDAL